MTKGRKIVTNNRILLSGPTRPKNSGTSLGALLAPKAVSTKSRDDAPVKKKKKVVDPVGDAPVKKKKKVVDPVGDAPVKKKKKVVDPVGDAPVKRKRGRPRKVVDESVPVVKRPRGRPRKIFTATSQTPATFEATPSDDLHERAANLAPLKEAGAPNEEELARLEIARRKLSNLKGTFKKYVPEASMLIEREQIGNSAQLIQRGMLMMLLDNIPLAESVYKERPTQSHAIAMQALINSGRDILAEIEQSNDGSDLVGSVMNEILLPNFQELGQHLVMALFHLRDEVTRVSDERTRPIISEKFSEIANEIRLYLTDKLVHMREKTMERIKKG